MVQSVMDRRYSDALRDYEDFPPLSESLRDCTERLMPFLNEELQPAMEAAVEQAQALSLAGYEYEVPNVVVVASENVLRGLVMHLEGLSETEIPLIDVPYAVPLVYHLDASLRPIPTPWAGAPLKAGWYLGDPAKVRAVTREVQADLPRSEKESGCFVGAEEPPQWEC